MQKKTSYKKSTISSYVWAILTGQLTFGNSSDETMTMIRQYTNVHVISSQITVKFFFLF